MTLCHTPGVMTGCPLCGSYVTSLSQLLVHMRLVHAGEPGFLVQCGIQGCPRTYRNFQTFRNHVYTIHSANLPLETEVGPGEPETSDDDDNGLGDRDNNGVEGRGSVQDDVITEEAIQRAAALLILKIREGHRVPLSVMNDNVADVGALYQLALSAIRQRVKSTMNDAGVSNTVVESTMCHLSDESPLTNIFRGLTTSYQQLQYFKKNFDLVVSMAWDIGVLQLF